MKNNNTSQSNGTKGLKMLRSGNPRSCTAPTIGSRTQLRKAELKTYNANERKNGRVKLEPIAPKEAPAPPATESPAAPPV